MGKHNHVKIIDARDDFPRNPLHYNGFCNVASYVRDYLVIMFAQLTVALIEIRRF